jgi:hypothetical protein
MIHLRPFDKLKATADRPMANYQIPISNYQLQTNREP